MPTSSLETPSSVGWGHHIGRRHADRTKGSRCSSRRLARHPREQCATGHRLLLDHQGPVHDRGRNGLDLLHQDGHRPPRHVNRRGHCAGGRDLLAVPNEEVRPRTRRRRGSHRASARDPRRDRAAGSALREERGWRDGRVLEMRAGRARFGPRHPFSAEPPARLQQNGPFASTTDDGPRSACSWGPAAA